MSSCFLSLLLTCGRPLVVPFVLSLSLTCFLSFSLMEVDGDEEVRLAGISSESLPLLFQDVVKAARLFKIYYLGSTFCVFFKTLMKIGQPSHQE